MLRLKSHKQGGTEVILFVSPTPPHYRIVIFQDEPYHGALVLRRELSTYAAADYEEAAHVFHETAMRACEFAAA